ncbi:sigma-54-dependent transcriptional regulator [Aquabacterium sp.]|uniref:sigma-54-dependent transcriptional regulator n=1 Tax=Aquabacterium sp. TaxID=1872578 RepID=UPI0037852EF7
MSTHHALVVDDDIACAKTLAELIAGEDFSVACAHSLRDARRQLVLQPPDLLLLDPQLRDGSGIELFSDTDLTSRPEVVLTGARAGAEARLRALGRDPAAFLPKPVDQHQLQALLARLMRPANAAAPDGRPSFMLGVSEAMQRIARQIERVAPTALTVLISGESGTGKEVVARALHAASRRRDKPMLALNCGAIAPSLVESELFGHERGSFTGAERQHRGFFERADGGTLFLDEVTEMSPALQVKLLRVLESGRIQRVGATQDQACDVRLIAATNRSPQRAVAEGRLRADLYYRLCVFPIELPPLRARLDDVPPLAEHFLAQVGAQEGRVKRFTPQALARLASCCWPGNVRELRNVVQRAYVMAEGDSIDEYALPPVPARQPAPWPPRRRITSGGWASRDRLRPR